VIKDAKCTAIFGRRGSGKSTLTRRLIVDCFRLVVLDPMREYGGKGWQQVTTLDQLHRAVKRGWQAGFRVSYTPAGDLIDALNALSRYLWAAQAPYDHGRDRRKLTLVVEEMNLAFPNHALPPGKNAFLQLILQGRHRGIEIIGVSQAPALLSTNFSRNCADLYIFPLGLGDDRTVIERQIGKQHGASVAALTPHKFLHVTESGTVESGANPPLGRSKSLRT